MADPVIKIHENFTISDGTSSSAFTTGDADYTPITFANKLSSDLNNTVTFGTTGGSGYLEFTNATTLTGMPNDIFAIPISDFFIKAGGRVNFRNVNLDAEMTIAMIKRETTAFGCDAIINDSKYPRLDDYQSESYIYTNIIAESTPTVFLEQYTSVAINQDGSIIACGDSLDSTYTGKVRVYERDTTATYGWTLLGDSITGDDFYNKFGQNLSISDDGLTIAGGNWRNNSTFDWNGYVRVWTRDITNTTVAPIGWIKKGQDLVGPTNSNNGDGWQYQSMSGDGNTIAVYGTNAHPIYIYKYNSSSFSWDLIGTTDSGYSTVKLSYDGTIIAMNESDYDSSNGRVRIFERDTTNTTVVPIGWTQIGNDIVGTTGKEFGLHISLNATGDIFATSEKSDDPITNSARTHVYKRDTNATIGWSPMGDPMNNLTSGELLNKVNLDNVGHKISISNQNLANSVTGILYVYKYNTTSLSWEHVITNNQITLVWNGGSNAYSAGGTDPIAGLHPNQYFGKYSNISGDGTKCICGSYGVNGTGSEMYIFNIPSEVVTTASSTLPAGDSFINNFVSKISTDMNESLTYDADNANIIFDDITTDMPISITSTDTTVFDTSITEITAAGKTLPFISYGQPEPSLSDFLIDNGESLTNLLNNNVKAEDIIKKQVFTASEWDSAGIPTNKFLDTFVNNYVDVSGGFALKNGDITVYDISFNSSVYSNITDLSNSLTVNNNLFTDSDMSLNSNLYIGGDLSVNGQFSGNFANNTIPYTAIQEYESTGTSTGNVSGSIFLLGDVSFNGDTVEVKNTEKLNVHEISSNGIIMGNNNRILQYDQIAKTETEVTRDNNATCTYSRHNSIFCSADGKYVAVLLGGDITDGNSTNSGIDISQDYGATWNMNYIRNDRHHGNFSMSQTGQYMITSVYGNTGDGDNTDHTIGYSSDFGSTWQNKNLSELIPGFNIIGSWRVLSVAMSPDGSYMIIALKYNNSGGKQLWISYDQSLVDNGFNYLFYLSKNIINMTIFKSELENHDTGKYDDLILITQEFNNNSYHFIYDLSGNEINVGYVDNTDTCISSSGAIHFRSQIDGSEINRYDLKGQNLHRPLITDIKSDLGSPGERMSFIMSPNGRHIIAAPYNNNGTNNPNIKHTSKIKYSNNGGYTWQSVDPLISTTLTTLAGSCISDEGHMYVVDKLSSTQVKYIAARFNYVNKLFTQLDVIDTATVNGTTTTTSDSRVKEDIEELNDKDTVDNLKPIEYDNILSKKHEYGLIAHELQEEYPYLVKGEKDGEDNQTINYQGIIGILVKEIQDLKKQIQLL